MNATELRNKSTQELKEELESLLKAQFNLRMQKATQQLTNTSQLSSVRRAIARVRTVLNEKKAQKTGNRYDRNSNPTCKGKASACNSRARGEQQNGQNRTRPCR